MSSGTLWDDFDMSQKYRAETIAFMRHSLGLSTERTGTEERPVSKIISNFQIGADGICRTYNTGKSPQPNIRAEAEMITSMQSSEKDLQNTSKFSSA